MKTPRPLRSLRRRSPRRGAAALEFALVLPVLITLFGGIIELSLFISTFHRVNRVARDAARVGSTIIEGDEPDGTLIVEAAEDHANLALDAAGLPCEGGCVMEATWEEDEDSGYFFITVDITYPYSGITNILPDLMEDGIRSRFSMVSQQQ